MFGVLARSGASQCVESAARSGVDFVCIDLQHGFGGFDSVASEIAACNAGGAVPLVRAPSDDPWQVGRPLDLGASGVIVPQISSPAAAVAAVAACHYPPLGTRSYGPIRSSSGSDDPDGPDRETMCFVMIETPEGLENVEQIAATPGLSGIYIGVTDLALTLGLSVRGYAASSEHTSALERIRAACDAVGVVSGMHCHNGREAREQVAKGFQLVTVGSDLTLLRGGIARELSTAAGGHD
ncbi:MAG TPA: aldolase/citrate lyase family protein [Solirubrobacteraceae bacterium]|nr:aldolase/citrate lyase family protein [Solirubrobacteraceae bacterium]